MYALRLPGHGLLARSRIERRPVVLGAAALLFVGIFVLRELGADASDGRALLYVLPVALIALELGLGAGLAAAGLAVGLLGLWSATTDVDLSAMGILTRTIVFVSVGAIAGRFSERMRRANAIQERLLDSGLLLARERDAERLERHVGELARRLVDERDRRRLSAQDRAGLAMLAQQAEAARETLRLLENERRRVRQLELVFEGQEQERAMVAHELHEQTAQALAGVLLGLDLLARDPAGEPAATTLAGLRAQVQTTLEACRELAVGLRPPVLEGIGLAPALERLAEGADVRRIEVDPDLAATELSVPARTALYRAVEEAIRHAGGPSEVEVSLEPARRALAVTVRPQAAPAGALELGPLQARLDLLGGSLQRGADELWVRIPLAQFRT